MSSTVSWQLDFLRESVNLLENWMASGKPGLSRETFRANILTLRARARSSRCCGSFAIEAQLFVRPSGKIPIGSFGRVFRHVSSTMWRIVFREC